MRGEVGRRGEGGWRDFLDTRRYSRKSSKSRELFLGSEGKQRKGVNLFLCFFIRFVCNRSQENTFISFFFFLLWH